MAPSHLFCIYPVIHNAVPPPHLLPPLPTFSSSHFPPLLTPTIPKARPFSARALQSSHPLDGSHLERGGVHSNIQPLADQRVEISALHAQVRPAGGRRVGCTRRRCTSGAGSLTQIFLPGGPPGTPHSQPLPTPFLRILLPRRVAPVSLPWLIARCLHTNRLRWPVCDVE
ncbi:hypothetical protein GQ53DRAFT_339834 [Thozetella sp. PMI_491]|nr:hypothetical protein GQ53DRAFT_339834 [Thozetella sp. PMI_491]